MATEQNITIHRGGSYSLEITLLDADGGPFDPTGKTLHYRIAHSRKHEPTITLNEPDITTALVDGEQVATVPLTTARTLALDVARYSHELYAIDNGERFVMMEGLVSVRAAQAAMHPAS